MLTTCDRCSDPGSPDDTLTICSNTCSDTTEKSKSTSSIKILDTITECNQECDGVTVICVPFCTLNESTSKVEEPVRQFKFTTMNYLEISIITLGARIITIKAPGAEIASQEILLGFNKLESYEKYKEFNVGGLVGKLKRTELNLNDINFDWFLNSNCELVLSCVLREEPEVYPCDLFLQIKYTICKNNTITIDYMARVARPVIFDIGYLLYMNLSGFECEKDDLKQHVIFINSGKSYDAETKTSDTVEETPYDLRIPVNFETFMKDDDDFEQLYLLTQDPKETMTFVSRIIAPDSGRVLELYTNQPAVLFKSTMFLPPCKPAEEIEEVEEEELEQDTEKDCEECEEAEVPTIIRHSNFPHCFLRHNMNVKRDENIVTSLGKHRKSCDTCSTQSASNADLESSNTTIECDYQNCGFLFRPLGMPPKGSVLKPGQEYHQKALFKFGYYCPMMPPIEGVSCCTDTTTTISQKN